MLISFGEWFPLYKPLAQEKNIDSWSFMPALNHRCLPVEAFKANGFPRKFISVAI